MDFQFSVQRRTLAQAIKVWLDAHAHKEKRASETDKELLGSYAWLDDWATNILVPTIGVITDWERKTDAKCFACKKVVQSLKLDIAVVNTPDGVVGWCPKCVFTKTVERYLALYPGPVRLPQVNPLEPGPEAKTA